MNKEFIMIQQGHVVKQEVFFGKGLYSVNQHKDIKYLMESVQSQNAIKQKEINPNPLFSLTKVSTSMHNP